MFDNEEDKAVFCKSGKVVVSSAVAAAPSLSNLISCNRTHIHLSLAFNHSRSISIVLIKDSSCLADQQHREMHRRTAGQTKYVFKFDVHFAPGQLAPGQFAPFSSKIYPLPNVQGRNVCQPFWITFLLKLVHRYTAMCQSDYGKVYPCIVVLLLATYYFSRDRKLLRMERCSSKTLWSRRGKSGEEKPTQYYYRKST